MFENDELNVQNENEEVTKNNLNRLFHIGGGMKMLLVVLLSILQFGLSAYLLLKVAQIEIVIPVDGMPDVNLNDYAFSYYFSIVISAIPPLLLLLVYLGAKSKNNMLMANTVHAAQTILKIYKWFMIVVFGLFGLLSIIMLLVVPGIALVLLVILGLVLAIFLVIIRIFVKFLFDLEGNLDQSLVLTKADPSSVLVLLYISFGLTLISTLLGFASTDAVSQTPYDQYLQPLFDALEPLSSIIGAIGIVSSLVMILVLRQLKSEFTEA
ncbi:MAG: hypothetical protein AB7E61_03040 [Acholeplasmataceae bacterium]